MTTTVHPSKDNQTNYLLSSIWFFEQEGNLDWTKIGLQGLLPSSTNYLDFTCEYQRGGRGVKTEMKATTKFQGRKEYVDVECPLPPWIKIDTKMSEKKIRKALESFSQDRTRIIAWIQMDGEEKKWDPKKPDPWQGWRNKPYASDAIVRQQSGSTYVYVATHELSAGDWESSGPPNKLAICLSPIRLSQPKGADDAKLVKQLKDMVEWRIWHGFGGVEVVHWTARNGNVGQWVNALNRVLGTHDTFLIAPNPVTANDGHRKDYGDQLMYLADCLMRYGVTDEWQAMTDLDEYLLARDDPQPYWIARRMELAPKTLGSFSIEQTYHGSDRIKPSDPYAPPHIDEFPSFPRNAYKDWDTMEKANGYRASKSMHRTGAIHSIWVHSATEFGVGYYHDNDKPGIAPDKGDYPSQLELLHDRADLPKKLVIEKTVDENSFYAWGTTWQDMAEVLRRPELAELWDPSVVAARQI
jgi:hypothetical protein